MSLHHAGLEDGLLVGVALHEHDVHDVVAHVPLPLNLNNINKAIFNMYIICI